MTLSGRAPHLFYLSEHVGTKANKVATFYVNKEKNSKLKIKPSSKLLENSMSVA